jgi:hypothetical protein
MTSSPPYPPHKKSSLLRVSFASVVDLETAGKHERKDSRAGMAEEEERGKARRVDINSAWCSWFRNRGSDW